MEVVYVFDTDRRYNNTKYNKKIRDFKKNSEPICCECKKHLKYKEDIKCDHIIPIAIGGHFFYNNLQILCELCHKHKTKFDTIFTKMLYSTRVINCFSGFNESIIKPSKIHKIYFFFRNKNYLRFRLGKETKRIDWNNKN